MKIKKIFTILLTSLLIVLSGCDGLIIFSSTSSSDSSSNSITNTDSNSSGDVDYFTISEILDFGINNHMYKTSGTITNFVNQSFFIQSGSYSLFINNDLETNLSVGNEVEVIGSYQSNGLPTLNLTEFLKLNDIGPNVSAAQVYQKDFTYENLENSLGNLIKLVGVSNVTSTNTSSEETYTTYTASFFNKSLYFHLDNTYPLVLSQDKYYSLSGNLVFYNGSLCLYVNSVETLLSVTEAREIVTWQDNNVFTKEEYVVYGKICSNANPSYGSFFIEDLNDTTSRVYLYRLNYLDGTPLESLAEYKLPQVGEIIIISGILGFYSSYGIEMKNIQMQEFFTERDISEPPVIDSDYVRINPIFATGDVSAIYNKDGSEYKTLNKETYYTELEDVAAYIITFRSLPVNYYIIDRDNDSSGYPKSKEACYNQFGSACRLSPGYYYSNYDYLPESLDGRYMEVDIGDETYASSSSWNRGALRIVLTYAGISAYGSNIPVLFYTDDHYDTFVEYGNYFNGWGKKFGVGNGSWQQLVTLN